MIEKIIMITLSPILVYLFGYYYPEYMMDSVNTTIKDLIPYIIIASLICSVFLLRQNKPRAVHLFFFWLSYGGSLFFIVLMLIKISSTAIISGMSFSSNRAATWITLFLLLGIMIFSRISRSDEFQMKETTMSIIIMCFFALGLASFCIKVLSFLMTNYRADVVTLPASLFFLGCVLYPINILFAKMEKNNS